MTSLAGIKAISFDVDGTLWDFYSAARSALGRVFAELEQVGPKPAKVLDVATFVEIRDRAHDELRGVVTKKYALGIISNGISYPKNFGLEGLIAFAVYSKDHCGIEKPDPRIFRIALEKSGCRPHSLLHVGGSLETDVAGARSAGIRSVWLNRGGRERDGDAEPDREIRSLRGLVELL